MIPPNSESATSIFASYVCACVRYRIPSSFAIDTRVSANCNECNKSLNRRSVCSPIVAKPRDIHSRRLATNRVCLVQLYRQNTIIRLPTFAIIDIQQDHMKRKVYLNQRPKYLQFTRHETFTAQTRAVNSFSTT